MSVWNLGIDDVSEETRNFKDKLSSKESQISAQQMKLMKQAAEMDELHSTLNDALHKLTRETNRVLQLESDLSHRSDELRNEKLLSQNVAQALAAAQEKIKLGELEARDLQANLESLSHTSDGHNSRSAKLERDKSTLEARVRELEASLRQLSSPPAAHVPRNALRPRSSSLSSFRITALERELNETRTLLSQKETDLWAAKESLSQARGDLLQTGNEKAAAEKRFARELAEVRDSMERKEDEVQYWKGQQDNGRREEELMGRIEEDEAKITMLEKLLGETQESPKLKDKLDKAEEKLKDERKRRSEYEDWHVELVKEKEDALDELEQAREEILKLSEVLRRHEAQTDVVDNEKRNAINADTVITTGRSEHTLLPMPQEAVTHIERLLVAIERLRGERDNLQRDMHFLESESEFAIQALKAKLAASPTSGFEEAGSAETITQLRAEMDALRVQLAAAARQGSAVILAKDKHIKRLVLAATASTVVIEHLQSRSDHLERQFLDTHHSHAEVEESLKSSRKCVKDMEEKLEELEVKLEVSVLCLEATTSQRNDVVTQLDAKAARDAEREDEIREVKSDLREARDSLEQTEIRLSNVSKALEHAESERDSLALQITNLSTDLRVTQEDLVHAENRFSTLQSHQLSSMTSNQAIRSLQDQIGELEMRVMRRTEQIGIHQHDIKRLETNLRLQEERLGEMTMELEMMAAQKDAMVEDCADAREARDETLALLDRMEVDMETRMEESDDVAASLVAVIFDTVSHSRDVLRRLNGRASKAEKDVDRLIAAHQQILDQNLLLEALRSSEENARQSTLALAVSQVALQSARACIHTLQEDGDHLKCEVKNRQDELLEECTKTTFLQNHLETLESQTSKEALDVSVHISELEAQVISLRGEILSAEAIHQAAIEELVRSQERLQTSLNEAQRSTLDGNLGSELVHIKASHAEELGDVQSRLLEASNALKDMQALLVSTKAEQDEASTEISRLQGDLEGAVANAQNAHDSRKELQALYDRVLDELAQVRQDHETRLIGLTDGSLAIRQELEGKLAELQSRFNEQSLELDNAVHGTGQLAQKLQESLEQLSTVKVTHQKQLRAAEQARHSAESALGQHQREMLNVKGQLEQSKINLETLQAEKLCLQEEITNIEADLQRSISLRRFLESQAQDSERKIASLTDDLERTQGDLVRSEKSAKAAEVNLSLQGAQHKREMANLQRELTLLRSQPNLADAISELEERNNEMEELLRNKCIEIEENDDRALEMLKENKKLASKVESLTRKVQNLQAKLTAAKASASKPETMPNERTPPIATAPPIYAACRVASTTQAEPQVSAVPNHFPPTVGRTPSHHKTSRPSVSHPKTPERRVSALPPVFKARTPEKRVDSETLPDAMPSTSTIGKKRPAPDDFEVCESVPPQGFTTESLPSNEPENEIPRVRRVLSGLHSGFTPVRHKGRPMVPLPSPKRPTVNSARASPMIADVTNSPRSASQIATGQSGKASKRSWLGKIRGVSTQPTGRDAR